MTERLQAMDQLWDSLARDGDDTPSPDWHQDVLADRKARAQRGEAKFLTQLTSDRVYEALNHDLKSVARDSF